MKHLIFYDGTCGLCNLVVQLVLKADKKELFAFAPLQGKTAEKEIGGRSYFREANSVILIENYQTPNQRASLYSQAVLRICWLLGGCWVLLGSLSFLPPFLFDWIYRLIARYRYSLFGQRCVVPNAKFKNRFLP